MNTAKPEQLTEKQHIHCGTPECCNECVDEEQKQTDYQSQDEEFANHCLAFFKGGNKEVDSEGGEI